MASVKDLVLASESPYRRALLAAAGLVFSARNAAVDEYAITASSPAEQAMARAEAKALVVAGAAPGSLVIGADQVLSLGYETFDKAADVATAGTRLRALSGRTHHLHSAVALAFGTGPGQATLLRRWVVSAAMTMRVLSDGEINAYLATGEWRGCVGCYQYEHQGVHLFDRVAADHSTIIGLPLLSLLGELRALGINPLVQAQGPWEMPDTVAG